MTEQPPTRNLVLVLGDQLSRNLAALDDFDHSRDCVWMAENHEEATCVWSHKTRLVVFFSAMRHFRDELAGRGYPLRYHELTHRKSDDRGESFGEILRKSVHALKPEKLILTEPGDWRVWRAIQDQADDLDIPLEVRTDRHFYCSIEEFEQWSQDRKGLVLEHFYQHMRKKHNVLMNTNGKPAGGDWNFDKQNRETFSGDGPGIVKSPRSFTRDEITSEVITMVDNRFGDHPGSADSFDLPVNHKQARDALRDFINTRLADFGTYQDALWTDQPFLYHSRLSAALNLHLLDPRETVQAAVEAYYRGDAPINSVEGFVRQILGWREFVRGMYWHFMPKYIQMNQLECDDTDVPDFFWNGETDMNCVNNVMSQVIEYAYAHHIQRLMVLGLFAQLLGVHPRKFHDWHMAMYADAVDWVSLPNALGMSQHGDGGIVGTKPYCASGNYINRMSNYCRNCRYNYKTATSDDACPFTTLYWDFLDRHHKRFENNPRMNFQVRNFKDKDAEEMKLIRKRAESLRKSIQSNERI